MCVQPSYFEVAVFVYIKEFMLWVFHLLLVLC